MSNEEIQEEETPVEVDHSNPVVVRKQKQAQKDEDALMGQYWASVLGSEAGRAVIWQILGWGNIHRSGMAPDAHHMAFECGKREIAVRLEVEVLTRNPQSYILMGSEAKARDERKRRRGKK